MTTGRFIAGIGALIWDKRKERYLILRRSESKDFAAGAWECVTGRLEQGEGYEAAAIREVREELGINVRPHFLLGTTHFHRGEERPETELVGAVFYCEIDGGQGIRLSIEHSDYRWLTPQETRALLSNSANPADHWLLCVIDRAELVRKFVSPELLDVLHQEGFELDN